MEDTTKLGWLIVPLISAFPIALSAQTCAEKQLKCDSGCFKSVGDLDEGKLIACEKNCYQSVGCPEKEGPGTRPWDVISTDDGTDPNGFLRNPIWAWQVDNPGPPFFDACNYCPCGGQGVEIGGVPSPDQWTADPTCTNQLLHLNDGSIYCQKGHMDWFPVAYEGMVRFEDHMQVFDNDYEFDVAPIHNNNALLTIDRKDLHIEFDSRETVDDWDGTGTWWEYFHHSIVDKYNKQQIAAWFGKKYALVIGMLGLDLYHGDHHSELHPVYAMFIRLDAPSRLNSLSQPQHWAFFLRNWGNEGICGPNDEPLPDQHISVRLPANKLTAANVWVSTNANAWTNFINGTSSDTCWKGSSMTDMASDGTIGFNLPQPSAMCSIVGDLTTVGPPITSTQISAAESSAASNPGAEVNENEPPIRAQFAKLSPGDQNKLLQQLQAMTPVAAKGPRARAIQRSHTLPQLSQTVAAEKRFVSVPNTALAASEAKKSQVIKDFLREHEIH